MSASARLAAALLGVLLLIGSHWYAYQAGNRNGSNAVLAKTKQTEIDRQAEVIEVLNAAKAAAETKVKQMAADAEKASRDHEREKQAIRAAAERDAGQRVRIDRAAFCGDAAGGTESAATGGDEQADSGAAFLPDSLARDLRRLAADADEVTADLRYLIRRVDDAGCFQ